MNHTYLFFWFLICCSFFGTRSTIAQTWYQDKASKDDTNGAYVDVLSIYEEMIHQGFVDENILKKTADAYFFQAEYRKAYPTYKLLFRKYSELEEVYYFRYMHTLKAVNRYDEADELMLTLAEKFAAYNLSRQVENLSKYKEKIDVKKKDYEIGITAINSLEADFAPSYYRQQVVFTSARDTGNFVKHRHKWNESPFTKFYIAAMNPRTKELSEVKPFAENLTTSDYHESSTAFTKDGLTMYFTQNVLPPKGASKKDINTSLLKIYRSQLIDGDWQEAEAVSFNLDGYNTAHPALSPDEKYLIFVSDRPGGQGKSDLWKVEIKEDGSFGEVSNLGNSINTSASESFPFVAINEIIYFASNGHLGLGGFDLFAAKNDAVSKEFIVQNLGAAVNSPYDDFALIIDSLGNGFFSTNRNVGRYKKDNIFRLKQFFSPDFENKPKVKFEIVDEETSELIPQTEVKVYNLEYVAIDSLQTNEVGKLLLTQPKNETKILVRFQSPAYEVKEIELTDVDFQNNQLQTISLRKRLQAVQKGKDLGKILQLEDIYFDLDKYFIRKDAAVELTKVLHMMKSYPDISIEIGSHTDSRASYEYNMTLSQNRANATKDWLVSKGISSKRISARGYGESKLVNQCKDGVMCTEEEHQANRRSEFIVVEIKE